MHKTISALFALRSDADNAVEKLNTIGYSSSDISVITLKDTVEVQHDTAAGMKDAVGTGAVVGGVAGLIAGLGALAIPGLGALFVTGPLAAALGLTGAAATTAAGLTSGIVIGGLLGALKEMGVDEVKAKTIEDRVKKGDVLLLISPADADIDRVKDILKQTNGNNIYDLDLDYSVKHG